MATVDDVANLFHTESTAQMKQYVTRFGRDLLDAATLHTLVEPATSQPHIKAAASWFAAKSPISTVVLQRDMCVLDVSTYPLSAPTHAICV